MAYLDQKQKFRRNLIAQYRQILKEDQRNLGEAIASCKDHIYTQVGSSAVCEICAEYFGWWCPNSADHLCEYDNVKDPNSDFCIYCGNPSERK